MLPVTETVFWISFIIVFYTYAGYPLILLLLTFFKSFFRNPKPTAILYDLPVTMIVAAYNEEEVVEQKIKNCLSLNYPRGLIHFLFITDGSTDNTTSIVKQYPEVTLLHDEKRKGKLSAMNRAMKFVKTDFVIFSDANTLLNEDSVRLMLRHYSDSKVGAVAGEKRIWTSGEKVAQGEGMYWKYESFVKQLDSRLYTVVGAAGELFSVRTSLYTYLPDAIIIEDFVQSLLICGKGYAVRYEPQAYSIEKASLSEKDEMERKIRISAGGFQAMVYLKNLLHMFKYPLVSFQYFSHRVIRWTLCPVSLVLLLITSLLLAYYDAGEFYKVFAAAQALFYFFATIGWWVGRQSRKGGIFYLPFYFVFMNFCVFAGFWRFATGGQSSTWQKVSRKKKNNL